MATLFRSANTDGLMEMHGTATVSAADRKLLLSTKDIVREA